MADRFYGLDRGEQFQNITIGAATGSTGIEVRINSASGLSRQEAITALREIERAIVEDLAYVAAET